MPAVLLYFLCALSETQGLLKALFKGNSFWIVGVPGVKGFLFLRFCHPSGSAKTWFLILDPWVILGYLDYLG